MDSSADGLETILQETRHYPVALGYLVPSLDLSLPICEMDVVNEYFSLKLHQAFKHP